MLQKFLTFALLIKTVEQKGGIEDNVYIADFYGSYYLIYGAPRPRGYIPNCLKNYYKEHKFPNNLTLQCDCVRRNTFLAVLEHQTKYEKRVILADILNPDSSSTVDIFDAISNDCECNVPGYDSSVTALRLLQDDCFIQYEKVGSISTALILCKKMKSTPEVEKMVHTSEDLRDREGVWLCDPDILFSFTGIKNDIDAGNSNNLSDKPFVAG